MRRKFLVELQFDGKNFDGFQKNKNSKTVQSEIESALKKLFEREISVDGCSRTDKGVSAKQFFFTFEEDTKLPEERVAFKLNRFLPKSVQCQKSIEVDTNFNLRKNILCKTYQYKIYTGKHIQPLKNNLATFVEGNLDVAQMIECSKMLIGKHNFKSFCNQNPDTTSFEREIFDIKIEEEDGLISMYFTADNFLYNMVRILAGTLVLCGQGKLTKIDLEKLFLQKDRSQNPAKTLPAKSLILFSISLKNLQKSLKN